MAIPIEATTVVIKNSAIDRVIMGGRDGLYPFIPEGCAFVYDEHLTRASFMSGAGSDSLLQDLERAGMELGEDYVILYPYIPDVEQYPDWLCYGQWGKATIAWLEGTSPDSVSAPEGWSPDAEPLQHYSAEEVAEKLEYLRTEDDVDVFLHKDTGEEVYSVASKSRGQKLFEEATTLAEPFLEFHGEKSATDLNPNDLERAIEMLEQAIDLEEGYWSASW
ncbi:MAG: hypothetical protein AAF226_07905, partial [Verrucomicrobiota bacterium]